ncbi:hypothetical protein I5E68_06965 [Novosphingobium sp. YJ-S2-02]|uniref:Uncharacterized protein n=1 Tax=Novosphingobium aureum TaxID=2792964 RepID=A0A931MKQ0_9SPHN|nr:hypothetical protein [Novosphingobium aureum]
MTTQPNEALVEAVAQALCRAGGYGLCVGQCHTERCMDAVEHYGRTARAIIPIVQKAAGQPEGARWGMGDLVQKKRNSKWRGKVVGFYQTEATPIGYAVESALEEGSVQVWPEAALEDWDGVTDRQAVEAEVVAYFDKRRQETGSADGWNITMLALEIERGEHHTLPRG